MPRRQLGAATPAPAPAPALVLRSEASTEAGTAMHVSGPEPRSLRPALAAPTDVAVSRGGRLGVRWGRKTVPVTVRTVRSSMAPGLHFPFN